MTTVKEIYRYIDTFAPFDSALEFDNCGILAGGENEDVQTALVTLDITKSVVEEAVKKGAQLIISHHPVIFHPLKSLSFESPAGLLIKHGISALCAHTNLDLSDKGVNVCLARALALTDSTPPDGQCMATGTLACPLDAPMFARYVKEKLHCGGVRFTNVKKQIKTVAVSGGAGGDSVYTALDCGADVLVTGEIKHSQILDAVAKNLCIVDAGHFKTENVVVLPLMQMLADRFDGVAFLPAESCTDTIEYA